MAGVIGRQFPLAFGAVLTAGLVLGPSATLAKPAPPAALEWSPSNSGSYDYGELVFDQSRSQVFTLTNTGGRMTKAVSVSLSGASDFTITANTCTGMTLAGGGSCTVTVRYDAVAQGEDSDTLQATTRRSPLSAFLSLSGASFRHIYWTNGSNFGSLGRARIDGTSIVHTFITGGASPGAVDVDASFVYWASFDNGEIGRANINGTGADDDFITGATFPTGLVVDASHIYWSNTTFSIGRADLNGQNVNQTFITGLQGQPRGLTVDGTYIYWANPGGTIGRATLDGQNVDEDFILVGAPNVRAPYGVAVDGGHVYWTDIIPDTIGRADLDGDNVDPDFIVLATNSDPGAVAVDGSYLYWTHQINTIGRATLDGQTVNEGFLGTETAGLAGVAIDE
jgi:hypothetical protein